jgi:hypothetical protein
MGDENGSHVSEFANLPSGAFNTGCKNNDAHDQQHDHRQLCLLRFLFRISPSRRWPRTGRA